jgi:hypothetical protein
MPAAGCCCGEHQQQRVPYRTRDDHHAPRADGAALAQQSRPAAH